MHLLIIYTSSITHVIWHALNLPQLESGEAHAMPHTLYWGP